MKKSLTALALAGVFAGSAFAAEVTLYGVVDYGMLHQQERISNIMTNPADPASGVSDRYSSTGLESGLNASSRFGLRGKEELGNGMTVSFKLENGFDADDGEIAQGGRLFGREASLSLSGNFGTLSAGRMGALGSSAGSYDIVMAKADAFDGGDNAITGLIMTSRLDNAVVYQSPKLFGLQATAQYSLKMDNQSEEGREGHDDADRYAGFALTGEYGIFEGVAAYEQILKAEGEDQKIASLGGNVDLDITKLFVMGQYFENLNGSTEFDRFDRIEALGAGFVFDDVDGQAWHLGSVTPVMGGELTLGLYYTDANADAADMRYYGGAARFAYPLSTRTAVYTGIGHGEWHYDSKQQGFSNQKLLTTQYYVGLTHKF